MREITCLSNLMRKRPNVPWIDCTNVAEPIVNVRNRTDPGSRIGPVRGAAQTLEAKTTEAQWKKEPSRANLIEMSFPNKRGRLIDA